MFTLAGAKKGGTKEHDQPSIDWLNNIGCNCENT